MQSDVSELINELRHCDVGTRLAAARALAEFDHLHADTLPALVGLLQDPVSDLRVAAIAALMKIWQALSGALSEVFAPGDEIDQVFGPLNTALLNALNDEDKYVRMSAAEGLRDLFCTQAKMFEVLVAAAGDPDESLRRRAALAFWLSATDRRATLPQLETETGIAVLIKLLQDQSQIVSHYALRSIATLGGVARTAAPTLTAMLANKNEGTRFQAAFALAHVVQGAQAAVPILADALAQGDRLKRKAAAFALRSIGAEARSAEMVLVKGLKDHEKRVRSRCAGTLGRIGQAVSDDAVRALLEAERDEDSEVRAAVHRALAEIGKEHVDAVQKKAAEVEARNVFPLFGFRPEEIPGFIFMLKDPNSNVRAMAATALGHLAAREAVPDLIALLNDEDDDVRKRVLHTLQLLGVSTAKRESAVSFENNE